MLFALNCLPASTNTRLPGASRMLRVYCEAHLGGPSLSTNCTEEKYEDAFQNLSEALRCEWPDCDVSVRLLLLLLLLLHATHSLPN